MHDDDLVQRLDLGHHAVDQGAQVGRFAFQGNPARKPRTRHVQPAEQSEALRQLPAPLDELLPSDVAACA